MNNVVQIIALPVLAGLLLFFLPGRLRILKGILALAVSLLTLWWAVVIFGGEPFSGIPQLAGTCEFSGFCTMTVDGLSRLILLFAAALAVLIACYTLGYKRLEGMRNFYSWFLITLGFTYGALLAANLLFFLVCWGILGITLYQLIPRNDDGSSRAASKTLVMIGASDGIMILGIALLWRITGTLNIYEIRVPTSDVVRTVACLSLLVGSFTKAGAFPLHTWIPDYSQQAPAASSAFLPASLDKLLGIYFLARITTQLFVLGDGMRILLLALGVITIITAVMMALIQHDYKRLLGFHAVSQVGYMVLGFGLGSLIGIAAGLFHMVNNAIYKGGLFLSAGAVEQQTGKSDLEELGGLSRAMPITFMATLIFALSISGIPPLNGFASKWMIYQGIIDFGQGSGLASQLWILWLACAVLGSALTLASFVKFLGGIFMGRRSEEFSAVKEVPPVMWLPMLVLAIVCIGFGVLATDLVVPSLFMTATGEFAYTGIWSSSLVGIMVLVSIVLGLLIYMLGNIRNYRTSDSFVGGEKFQDELSYRTPEFYKSFQEFSWLKSLYRRATEKWFDIYDQLRNIFSWMGKILSRAHSGVLHDYALWVFAGLVIILIIMIT